ncbi:MAG: hypothetical protein BWY00_01410 [Firmicutes bacterium ADurb.Bin153]|nr:MAG: hypothetical protein BWY00_01410 [Firmicutes bacterium ADurb.Bin153]
MEFIVGICFTVRPIRTIIGAVIEVGDYARDLWRNM